MNLRRAPTPSPRTEDGPARLEDADRTADRTVAARADALGTFTRTEAAAEGSDPLTREIAKLDLQPARIAVNAPTPSGSSRSAPEQP
jgi:hypothetical protein